jgi:hypothetical protein
MNLLATDLANLFRCSWIQGCMVILVLFWAFLALLGIRNSRFPWRILGGLSFVIGSTLWLGLHPGIEFDTGDLGRVVQHSLASRIPSAFALTGLSALLLVCSLIGLLVAIDWLPLIPFAPMLARAEERRDRSRQASVPTDFVSPKIDRPDDDLAMARASAAALAPRVRATPAAPAGPEKREPAAPAAVAPAPTPIPAIEPPASAPPPPPRAEERDATEDELDDDLESEDGDDDAVTNWARFRPRTRAEIEAEQDDAREMQTPQADAAEEETAEEESAKVMASPSPSSAVNTPEIDDEMPVDKGVAATHNSTTPGGESRAVEDDASAKADAPAGSSEEKKEDAPVLDRDQDPTEEAPTGATAVAEPFVETPDAALAETLAPRRKKEEEEEPAEEPGKEDDEEEGDDEEGDEEDFDDEDSEEDEEEEFEEEDDDKEEDKEEEEEEEEEEDWDDEEEEEEDEEEDEDDDEDWEDDEDEEDDEEDKEEEEGDKSGRTDPPALAESVVESAASQDATAVELAPAEEAAPEADAAVEILSGDSREPAVVSDDVPADGAVASLLFPDLPDEERTVMVRAVDLIAGTESVSLSRLQRELGITYYAAARVFERLEKEGFLAPYTGSLARGVRITREEWTALKSDGGSG